MFVFFFKQKTAYEMRISDWSSDVCSSDLSAQCRRLSRSSLESNWRFRASLDARRASRSKTRGAGMDGRRCPPLYKSFRSGAGTDQARASELSEARARSEEHTSELQSLIRISYAVFLSKKKKRTERKSQHTNTTK